MSFILDALKKLERERETREPGVLMVGPVQWGGPERPRGRRRLAVGAALVAVVAAAALWWLSSRPASAPSAPEVSVDAAAPVPRSTPTPPAVPAPPPWSLDRPGDGAEERPARPAETATIVEDPPLQLEDADPDAATNDTPTSPPVREFRLTAISERDGEPIALLNDRLVREGDSFEGLRILRIGDAEVEIEVRGERQTIGF